MSETVGEVDPEPEGALEEASSFGGRTVVEGGGRASKLHNQHGRGCAGLLADADFDRPVTRDQGTPVAGTVPAVDGVMGTAP